MYLERYTSQFHAALDEMKWWQIIVMVIAVILCLIGVVFWITVAAVVSNLPDNGKCKRRIAQQYFRVVM